jgi:segregation and condensation protein A
MLEEAVDTENGTHPYQISLDVFEGPLDLLLHLIKENKVDIYNIPISQIADQYLDHIRMMEELDLDVAGEFIVMAATLAHIKSKLLVPPDETQDDPEEEGRDPRAELVRRLLEYQKYKNAADQLWGRPMLERDVFKRERTDRAMPKPTPSAADLVEISVFKLVEAFHKLLKNLELTKPHSIAMENLTVSECVRNISESIRSSQEGTLQFVQLFEEGATTRQRLVTTFIALLEMLKRGAVRVIQAEAFSEIYLMGTPLLYGEWKYDGTDEQYGQAAQLDS